MLAISASRCLLYHHPIAQILWHDQLVAHGQSWLLLKRIELGKPSSRIDAFMVVSLTYVMWFGLFPLFRLAG